VVRTVSIVPPCSGDWLFSWQSETAGLNMVSTRQQAYSKKTVITQMEGLPKCSCSGLQLQGVPEPAAARGEWQGFHLYEV